MKGKVLVTGGAGVIGRPLVGKLLQQGVAVTVIDTQPRPKEWPKDVDYWNDDINQLNQEQIIKLNPDYCFHLAASFERSEELPAFFQTNFYNNILVSHALLNVLKQCPHLSKVIFASSYLVYDPNLYLFETPPKKRAVLDENSALNPRNLCGNAKLLHERELEFVSRFANFSTVSARIFRVYGKGSNDVISRWIRSLIAEKSIEVYGKEGVFDYIYADEAAEGLIKLADSNLAGPVNLGTGKSRRIVEVLNILKSHFPNMIVREKKSDVYYEASQASMQYFVKEIKWRPSQTLEKAIPKIIAYEKANPGKF